MLDLDSEHATRPAKFLFGTVIVYLGAGVIQFLPDLLVLLYLLAFLVFWLGGPIALYKDRRYVREHTDWDPSKAYYLGVLPGYLGMGAYIYYFIKRNERFENLDEPASGERHDDADGLDPTAPSE